MIDCDTEFNVKMKNAVLSDNKTRISEIQNLLEYIELFELETEAQIKGALHNRLEELKINGAKYERELAEIKNV